MKHSKPDKKADILKIIDRGENLLAMEPLLISESSPYRAQLFDLALELATKSAGFRHSLPNGIQSALADLVRSMNCYYSNLIEGHNTHPIDIERALHGDYSKDTKKRNLQLEAKAHIHVQQWIEQDGLKGDPFTLSAICEVHKRFGNLLPEELLWVEDPKTNKKIKIIPGAFRDRDVAVGNHIAISAGAIPRFLSRYESVYSALGKAETILASAAAHHRLLWIHPFLDGNGRVARLISHAAFLNVLDTGGIWSIARGLARNEQEYKTHLAKCDLSRRNDLDGRGNLSEESLVEFTQFFLKTCLDQVNFMEQLMQPNRLRARILLWAQEEISVGTLPQQSSQVLESVLYRGELPRGEIPNMLNVTERHARRITTALIEKGVLTCVSPKSPLKLAFPAKFAERWMPGLFPDR